MSAHARPCLVCKSIAFPEGDRPTASVSDFDESRKAGCMGCGMILDAIDAFDPDWADTHAADGSIQLGLYYGTLSVYLSINGSHGFHRFVIFQGQDDPNSPRLKNPFLSCLEILPNNWTGPAFARISSWLAECSQNHVSCRAEDSKFMPCRLLDVGSTYDQEEKDGQGLSRQGEVRLFEPNPAESFCMPAPYAALSYCWGSDLVGVLKTEQDNLKAHRDGIPLDSLSKTVQDAVLVCRGLGIRYLWVDALCIVQDDMNDWRRESSQMHRIYSNSRVTIAVHEAVSCKDGFLGEQSYGQPSWQRTFTTKFWLSGTDISNTRVSTHAKMHLRVGEPPHKMSEKPSPLMHRGWTLQEAVLPRRIVHFTGAELVWECATRHFCECGHVEGLTSDGGTPMVRTEIMCGHEYDTREELVVDGWMRLVEKYTRRKLSHASDKLIAVSGIAQMFGAMTSEFQRKDEESRSINSIYLAGVFRTSLPRQLLWHTQDHGGIFKDSSIPEAHPRPSPYRAPTWSWASIDTPILYPSEVLHGKERSHILVHDKESFCMPVLEGDQTGAIKSGVLSVEGLVVPVELTTVESTPPRHFRDVSDYWADRTSTVRGRSGLVVEVSCDVKRPVELNKGDVGYKCRTDSNDWDEEYRPVADKCELAAKKWSETEYCCLRVATYSGYLDTSSFFLVLERSKTVKESWERIGIGMMGSMLRTMVRNTLDNELNLFEGAEVRKLQIV